MPTRVLLFVSALWLLGALWLHAQASAPTVATTAAPPATLAATTRPPRPPRSPATQPPPTTLPGKVGDLLRQWWDEGTAAGNVGDRYDNRDRGHSFLDLKPFPQLGRITYSGDDARQGRDWAVQTRILPGVILGNSSTAAPALNGGSNPRIYYSDPQGLSFLYTEYRRNNLYIYPAHHDHHPGHNGATALGDLFPANSPYLIVSQGSSWSDQPFMRACALTLAAFRPEVKKKLVETGLLIPTVQMLFRSTNKQLTDPKEYLTGKAHPSVFDGTWVNELAMVQKAHEMTVDTIPPLAVLKVVREDEPVAGVAYLDAATERLGDSACAIARLWRGRTFTRKLTVSAEESLDVNQRPLRFEWVLLQGDPARVKITPEGDKGAVAQIELSYPVRRPVAPKSAMESNRVDIGVFVHNGANWSPPSFVTFFSFDSEARVYDKDGRIVEIGYGVGEPDIKIDYRQLFEALRAQPPSPGAALLLKRLDKLAGPMLEVAQAYAPVQAAADEAQAKARVAEAATTRPSTRPAPAESAEERKQAQAAAKAARDAATAAQRKLDQFVEAGYKGLPSPPYLVLTVALRAWIQDLKMTVNYEPQIAEAAKGANETRAAAVAAARKRLVAMQVLADGPGATARPMGGADAGLNAYERSLLQRYNGVVLSNLLLPGAVNCPHRAWYADPRLTAPKDWRDVYHYDARGQCVGWTRYQEDGAWEFAADGRLVVQRDAAGKPTQWAAVKYTQKPLTKAEMQAGQMNWNPLVWEKP